MKIRIIIKKLVCLSLLSAFFFPAAFAQDPDQGVSVNGDNVEYSTEEKKVSASGNVEVKYKDSTMTCNSLRADTVTKDTEASGNVKVKDARGIIEAESFTYNLKTKTGEASNAAFNSPPFFGRAASVRKAGEKEIIAKRGYYTTCDYDVPDYRISAEEIDFKTGERITARENIFRIWNLPFFYLPYFSHSMGDPFMHVQITPGTRGGWGPFLLTTWRCDISDNVDGRIYLDYRSKLGTAGGVGTNYDTKVAGKGNFKFYYTHEKDTTLEEGTPDEFERYLIRWRHKWDIDRNTSLINEYYKIKDSKRALLGTEHNILKDYFYKEYESDSQPLSYSLLHHSFSGSSLDVLLQKRTNRWYEQLEKLPEIKYNLPDTPLGDSPFYFDNSSSYVNLNYKKAVPSSSSGDLSVNRLDTFNKVSLPSKVGFVEITPFVGTRETFYDKDINNSSPGPRTIFYSGADASTRFFRVFNVRSNALGMDINGLRHVITPTVKYAYNHEPTVSAERLKYFDELDSIVRSNAFTLELSNKLQTKRKNGSRVDLLDLRIETDYSFDPRTVTYDTAFFRQTVSESGSKFGDLLFYLDARPYDNIRLSSMARYDHLGDYFKEINYDVNYDFAKERSVGVGQRYANKQYDNNYSGNQITLSAAWRFNPKWKFELYERYQVNTTAQRGSGLIEQQYMLSRDLHCWIMNLAYDIKEDTGHTIWIIFRLKAFPEVELGFDQSYHSPSSGSQQ
ncbi:MAG: LPS assembly protein LptD [Candidatus Omnitrophota bacterium]